MSDEWESVNPTTAKLSVPGGWLYRTIISNSICFVPDPASERALRQALTWCVTNDGECLADHPAMLRRFREIVGLEPI